MWPVKTITIIIVCSVVIMASVQKQENSIFTENHRLAVIKNKKKLRVYSCKNEALTTRVGNITYLKLPAGIVFSGEKPDSSEKYDGFVLKL